MGFFSSTKPLITKEEADKVINELRYHRGKGGQRLFSEDHLKYVRQELDSHMDADSPGQYSGVTQEEGAQVVREMTKPNPIEQDVQRRFGIKHGFNQEQADAVSQITNKYLRR